MGKPHLGVRVRKESESARKSSGMRSLKRGNLIGALPRELRIVSHAAIILIEITFRSGYECERR